MLQVFSSILKRYAYQLHVCGGVFQLEESLRAAADICISVVRGVLGEITSTAAQRQPGLSVRSIENET